MAYKRIAIKGRKVRERRRAKRWTQKVLEKKSGIALTKIIAIEADRGTYDPITLTLLAQALDVDVEELVYSRDLDWRAVPDLPTRSECTTVARAIRLDMDGCHAEAAKLLKDLVEKAKGTRNAECYPRAYAEVRIRLLTFLDNAGLHDEALLECDAVLDSLPSSMMFENRWLRYHHGIIHRRLEHYDLARSMFYALRATEDRTYWVCCEHQLAVIDIQLAKREPDPRKRAQYLDDAVAHLQASMYAWNALAQRLSTAPHRKGFTLQRLAEAYELQERLDEAVDASIEAVKWLAWHHCRRYAEDAAVDLRRLIDKKAERAADQARARGSM